MIAGACLCGALRYELASAGTRLVHCHCRACRRHHGAPFASYVEVERSAVEWREGEEKLVEDHTSGRPRRACATCGAVAPTLVDERVLVPAGNLAADLEGLAHQHTNVGEKAAWHTIVDDAPKEEGALPGWPDVPSASRVSVTEHSPADERGGSCLCGSVRFTVRGAPGRWFQCHCSRCRRARSAAHGSNCFYAASALTWVAGRELVRDYRPADAARFTASFCARCGGGAPVEREGVPFALVPAALLEDGPDGLPQAHIHVASRAAWTAVGGEMPRFDELPPMS